jgi:hypothetical protein
MAPDVSREPRAWLPYLCGAAARLCLFVVGGAYVAYLVGMNLFLAPALFEMAVDRDPRTLDVHFERGWSLRPGRIHARGLSIRSRDGSVEWLLRIRDVQFDVSFRALAQKRFEVAHVHGVGGSFRLRNRLDAWEVSPARLAGLPPIEGYPAVPVRPYTQCSANEWSDAHYHLWTIQLEDVHAEAVKELWINRYRLDGDTSTTGRFYLKPVRAVEVGPLHTEIRGSRLSVGGASWVEGLDGTADFELPRFDPRVTGGRALLHEMSAGVETHGVVPDVGLLPLPLPRDVHVGGALDLRRLGLRLEDGGPRRGSHLDAVGPRVVVEQGDHRISSSLAVTGDIEQEDDRLAFHAVAGGVRVERAGRTLVAAPRVDVGGTSGHPDVDHGVEGLHVTAESADIELPDVRVLASYIPPSAKVTLVSGRARAAAWAEAWPDDGRAAGRASMQAEDLDVRVGDMHASGGIAANASLASFDWRTGAIERPEASATVTARVETAPTRDPTRKKDFAADVRAVALTRGYSPEDRTIDVSGSGVTLRNMVVAGEPAASSHGDAWLTEATLRIDQPLLEGVASVDVTDATPLIASVRDHVPAPFRSLMNLPRLLASARLTVDARRVELREMEAHGGSLAVHGLFAAGRGDRLGAFVVEGGPVSVGVGVDPRGAHVHFFGLSGWLQQEEETVNERFGAP